MSMYSCVYPENVVNVKAVKECQSFEHMFHELSVLVLQTMCIEVFSGAQLDFLSVLCKLGISACSLIDGTAYRVTLSLR